MDDLWLAVRWLHLLAMAFFVGGQLVLAVAVVPVERHAPDRERLRAVARRFGYGARRRPGRLAHAPPDDPRIGGRHLRGLPRDRLAGSSPRALISRSRAG